MRGGKAEGIKCGVGCAAPKDPLERYTRTFYLSIVFQFCQCGGSR